MNPTRNFPFGQFLAHKESSPRLSDAADCPIHFLKIRQPAITATGESL